MACAPEAAARKFMGKAPMFWGLTAEARIKALVIVKGARQPVAYIAQAQPEIEHWDQEEAAIMAVLEASLHDEDEEEDEEEDEYEEEDDDDEDDDPARGNAALGKRLSQHAQKKEHVLSLREAVADQEKSLIGKAEQCAALLCPPLAASVHQSLPRELRDMIYDLLWYQKPTDKLDQSIADLHFGERNDMRERTSSTLIAPFFADPRYTGQDFAHEAAERFFGSLAQSEVHYQAVQGYLQIDLFGSLPLAPRDFIRRLTINIEWSFSVNPLTRYGYTTGHVASLDPAWEDLERNLDSLLSLPAKDNFSIVMYLSRDLQFSRNLFRALDTIKPVYSALVAKGMRVKVLGYRFFTPNWRFHTNFANGPDRNSETAEQLNYYFDRTPEEWFSMVGTELEAIKQSQRKVGCLEILNTMRRNLSQLRKEQA